MATLSLETKSGIWEFDPPEAFGCDEGLASGLYRWIVDGVIPGSFLCAVLRNDFMDSCLRADPINKRLLAPMAEWLFANAPSGSYGSEENFKTWTGLNSVASQIRVASNHKEIF